MLGSHEIHAANQRPGARERTRQSACEAKIHNFHAEVGGEEKIAWLQIPVNQMVIVRRLQPGSRLARPLACARDWLRAVLGDEVFNISTRHQFENEKVQRLRCTGCREYSRVVCRHDIGMIDRCEGTHLGSKALEQFLRDGIVRGKGLNRHAAAEQGVFSQEDDRRASAADAIEHSVRAKNEAGRVPGNDAIALVVGDQTGLCDSVGGALARRQSGKLVCGLQQEVLDCRQLDEWQIEQLLEHRSYPRRDAG